jgi:hypothetical protein
MTSGYNSLKVEVAFGSDPLGTLSWTDISTDVRSITTQRGRASDLEQFSAGTAEIVLNNQDDKYDPDNAAGPHFGQLLPMVPVRISATDAETIPGTWRIFTGFVQPRGGWQFSYGGGANKIATVAMTCVDMFAILATIDMPAIVADPATGILTPLFPSEHTSHYLLNVLDLFGLGGNLGVSDTSLSIMSGYLGGMKVLDWIQKVALSEGGAVYVAADGTLQFANRLDLVGTSVKVTFADNGTGVAYSDFQKEFATVIYNKVTVTTANGISSSASDATSITAYTESDYTLDGLFVETAADAAARAEWYLLAYKDPVTSPSQIILSPRRSEAVLLAALELDLRDRVQVKFKPPAAAGEVTAELFVRSIGHQIDAAAQSWTVSLGFESTSRFGFQTGKTYFTLGSSLLGGGDVLAL